MSAHLVLAVLAILAARVGFLYLRPFGRCPRCKGQRRIKRTGSRAVHRAARKIRDGRRAAARYQQEDSDGTP